MSQTGEGHRWTPVVSHGVRGSSPGIRRLYSPAPVQHRRGRSMVAVELPVRASLRLGRGRFRPVRTIRTILRNGRASERPFSGGRARAKRARSRWPSPNRRGRAPARSHELRLWAPAARAWATTLLCTDSCTSSRLAAARTSTVAWSRSAGAVDRSDDFLRCPAIPSSPGCLNRQSAELGWRSDADFPGQGDVDAVKPEPAEIVDRSPYSSVGGTFTR